MLSRESNIRSFRVDGGGDRCCSDSHRINPPAHVVPTADGGLAARLVVVWWRTFSLDEKGAGETAPVLHPDVRRALTLRHLAFTNAGSDANQTLIVCC